MKTALAPLAIAAALASACKTTAPGTGRISLDPPTQAKALGVLREGLQAQGEAGFWPAMHAAEGLTLGGYGAEVLPALEARIAGTRDARQRCGLAREMVRAGDRSKVAALAEVLASPDPYGHIHAAESLFKVYEVGDPVAMRRHFASGPDLKLQLMAAAALGRHGDMDAMKFIRETLEGPDPEGLQIAAWILGQIGNAQDIAPLRAKVGAAPSPLIRAYVEHALAALGDADGLVALARNLDSPDPAIRTYAADFAGIARAAFARPKLERMLDDPHLDARVRAAQALLMMNR